MSKKEEFTPVEWDILNTNLNESIAVAYPELSVTPYIPSKGKRRNAINQHRALPFSSNKRHKNTGSRRKG